MSTSDGQRLYFPLDQSKSEIRVLRVLPSCNKEGDNEIRCMLVTGSLDVLADKYIALSYMWGDPNETISARLEGELVYITSNLAAAVLRFRSASPYLYTFGSLVVRA